MALDFKKETVSAIETIETKAAAPEIKPKGKKGRPKGAKNKKTEEIASSEENKAAEKPKTDIEVELADLTKKHGEKIEEGKTIVVDKTTTVDPAKLNYLNGYMLLVFSDFLFPTAISYFFKNKMKKSGKTTKDLKMTKEERENMKEIADAAAKEISLGMNAVQMYLVGSAIIYGSKLSD
jgi:hypothetical protein